MEWPLQRRGGGEGPGAQPWPPGLLLQVAVPGCRCRVLPFSSCSYHCVVLCLIGALCVGFRFAGGERKRRLCCCWCCSSPKRKQQFQGKVVPEKKRDPEKGSWLLEAFAHESHIKVAIFDRCLNCCPNSVSSVFMRRPLSELPEFRRAAAAAPVVGWPPVRAFRRNLASSSSKLVSHEPSSQRGSDSAGAAKAVEAGKKGLFVKINMDGVPIGRKLDLRAHAGYDTLSAAVDHLFRGLLAGMRCLILVFTALYLRNL